jgi:hypothetical protein
MATMAFGPRHPSRWGSKWRPVLILSRVAHGAARSADYHPPKTVAECLNGAEIFAAGPSELANLLGWLTGGATHTTRRNTRAMEDAERTLAVDHNRLAAARSLSCSTRRNLGDRHFTCAGNYRAKAACREQTFGARPFEANCTGSRAWKNASFRVHYVWKSYQLSEVDRRLYLAAKRSAARRVIVVLSNGLQHFSRFDEHREELLHRARDDFDWPQQWIDDWLNETTKLMDLYAPLHHPQTADRSTGSRRCIIWRAQNIASRHSNASESHHHPSSRNGVHNWLNRISSALARRFSLGVLDLTDMTVARNPLGYDVSRFDLPQSGAGRPKGTLEGDVYHGYQGGYLGPMFLQRLAEACCLAAPR